MGAKNRSAIKNIRMRPRAAQLMLEALAQERHLTPRDRICLAVQGIARKLEEQILPPGGSVSATVHPRDHGRCITIAVNAVVWWWGARPVEWCSWMRALCREFCRWQFELGVIGDNFIRGVELGPRELTVLTAWRAQRDVMGLRRNWSQFLRAAQQARSELGLPDSPDDARQDLLVYRRLTLGGPGHLFVGRDGQLRLGPRQLRDRLASEFGLRRRRGAAAATAEYQEAEGGMGQVPDPDGETPAEAAAALEAVEMIRQLREVLERRMKDSKAGSLRHHILQSFEALESGVITVRGLAAREACDFSALARAYRAEREAVLRELGISPE